VDEGSGVSCCEECGIILCMLCGTTEYKCGCKENKPTSLLRQEEAGGDAGRDAGGDAGGEAEVENPAWTVLDIFSGTGSVGRVAEQRGCTVFSLDNRPETNPSVCADILNWDYTTATGIPDFIWFSPPCTTFSLLGGGKHRTIDNMEGNTEEARVGMEILQRVFEIIRLFTQLNPNLRRAIENPRALMRHVPELQGVRRATANYCQYNRWQFFKPTDFWSNFPLVLNTCSDRDSCHHLRTSVGGIQISSGVQGTPDIREKYAIPSDLIASIFDQAVTCPDDDLDKPDFSVDPSSPDREEPEEKLEELASQIGDVFTTPAKKTPAKKTPARKKSTKKTPEEKAGFQDKFNQDFLRTVRRPRAGWSLASLQSATLGAISPDDFSLFTESAQLTTESVLNGLRQGLSIIDGDVSLIPMVCYNLGAFLVMAMTLWGSEGKDMKIGDVILKLATFEIKIKGGRTYATMYVKHYRNLLVHGAHKFNYISSLKIGELLSFYTADLLPNAFKWLETSHPNEYTILCSEKSKEEIEKALALFEGRQIEGAVMAGIHQEEDEAKQEMEEENKQKGRKGNSE